MFSIYILTYNEERDIADCIESALLSDDVIIVDSFSGDRTVEIAKGIAENNPRSEEHTSELQSLTNLVCRLLLEKKKLIHN